MNLFIQNSKNRLYTPTVFENYVTEVYVEGKTVDVALWDTPGQDDYSGLKIVKKYNKHNFLNVLFFLEAV